MSTGAPDMAAIAAQPFLQRTGSYIRLGGPGWLQGAMTLGGGSAITSLTIGALYGYELLWVQPVAMIIGCIMLFALSHQTLSTGVEPFEAMRKYVNSPLAWAWALAALISSIIWGFSHYPLSAGMLEESIAVATGFSLRESGGAGREMFLFALAVLVWAFCALTAWNYGKGGALVRTFENGIKLLTTTIVLCFAWVVISATMNGGVDWGAVFAGLIPTSLPDNPAGWALVMSALGSAVGINMTFVFGYTLLARGWNSDHRELARYDIVLGLVIPYFLVTGLISIAAAGALYGGDMEIAGKLAPNVAAGMFADAGLGDVAGRLIFTLGILGMAAGSLVMHMLACGAAAKAMFNLPAGSRAVRLWQLAPTPAVLGVFVWSTMGPLVVLPTSAISGLLLPLAYGGWLALNNSQAFLGADMPDGGKRSFYNLAMASCIALVTASFAYAMYVTFIAS